MKKNIFILPFITAAILANAQDTYIGNKAVVKVSKNTLFYNGGSLNLQGEPTAAGALQEKVIINDGNIHVKNTYKNTINNSDGKHFVNTWSGYNSYGQLIIETQSNETGKLTMQKKSANSTTADQYPMGFPFIGNVTNLMETYKDEPNPPYFRGNCGKDVRCTQRNWMTLYKWNNEKIVNGAVTNNDDFQPGAYYLLNLLSNTGLKSIYADGKTINYKGTPTNGVIAPLTSGTTNIYKTTDERYATFFTEPYNNWKRTVNDYNERYESYLGYYDLPTDLQFAKNMFRFANPYTSNISLNDVSSWLTIDGGPLNAEDQVLELLVLADDFKQSWLPNTSQPGTQNIASEYYRTNIYDPGYNGGTGIWTGESSGASVIIKPFQMFRITIADNTKLINNIKINLNEDTKTFAYNVNDLNTSQRSNNTEARTESVVNDFHQLKISLLNTDNIPVTDAVFLATNNALKTGKNIVKHDNRKMLLVEEDIDGGVIANATTLINRFNSEDYIGKPLNLQLNNLTVGTSYKLRFNLNENSIFTDYVDNYSSGNKFYIHDKLNDTYTEINATTVVNINATEQTKNQYAFYWKTTPRSLGTDNLVKAFKTQVYKFNQDTYNIKLDPTKVSANLEIYAINGTKVATQNNIKVTQNDTKLNIPNGQNGLFIVKVTYDDGAQNNIKVLVD